MSKASELLTRVISIANSRNIFPYYVGGVYKKGDPYTEINGNRVNVEEIHKHNGTAENASVRIIITAPYGKFGTRIILEKIKVPSGASDNVINKRLDKAVEIMSK